MQFRELASRERDDARRRRYLALASQSETLAGRLEQELPKRPRSNVVEHPPALHGAAAGADLSSKQAQRNEQERQSKV